MDVKFKIAADTKRLEEIVRHNIKEANEAFQQIGLSMSEEVETFIKKLDFRFGKLTFIRNAEDAQKLDGVAPIGVDTTTIAYTRHDTKYVFPQLLLYDEEAAELISWRAKATVLSNKLKSAANPYVESFMKELESRWPESFSKFQEGITNLKDGVSFKEHFAPYLDMFPTQLPEQIKMDGSRERLEFMASKEGSTSILDNEGNILAVIHPFRRKDTNSVVNCLTLYVEELNPMVEMVRRLTDSYNGLCIDDALLIAESVPHDRFYYSVNLFPRGNDNSANEYVFAVAKAAGFSEEGVKVEDLLQSDVDVAFHDESNAYFINIDDEESSAVLVGTKLFIYMPATTEKSTD